jgi:hypothetical protein
MWFELNTSASVSWARANLQVTAGSCKATGLQRSHQEGPAGAGAGQAADGVQGCVPGRQGWLGFLLQHLQQGLQRLDAACSRRRVGQRGPCVCWGSMCQGDVVCKGDVWPSGMQHQQGRMEGIRAVCCAMFNFWVSWPQPINLQKMHASFLMGTSVTTSQCTALGFSGG